MPKHLGLLGFSPSPLVCPLIDAPMKRLLYPVVLVGLFFLAKPVLLQASYAQTSTTPAPAAADPASILKAASDYLKKQPAFTFTNQITYDNILSGGDKVQYHGLQTVYVQRPNSLRADYEGDFRKTRVFYDGSTLTWLDVDQNIFYQAPAPNTLDAVIQSLLERNDGAIPMANMVTSDPFSAYNPQDFQAQYLGISAIAGVPAHNLLFLGQQTNWQVFISTGDRPLVQKVVITYKSLPGAPQYMAEFTEWEFPNSQPANLFVFQAPANAVRVSDRSAVLNLNLPSGVAAPGGLTPPPLTPTQPGLNDPNLEPPSLTN